MLKFLTEERHVVIPQVVARELERQCDTEPVLWEVLQAEWITVDHSDDVAVAAAFSRYEERLVPLESEENLGECGVLALGSALGWEMVLDDGTARQIAEDEDLRVTATLPLLCDGIRERRLTISQVEHLADELIAGDYRLPFGPGGFRHWAMVEGVLNYDELTD
ncbi:MAG: nucleotide-binding protein [Cellulomonadaceae bacterium]